MLTCRGCVQGQTRQMYIGRGVKGKCIRGQAWNYTRTAGKKQPKVVGSRVLGSERVKNHRTERGHLRAGIKVAREG